MAVYVIYQAEVLDSERYEIYKPAAAESVRRAGGRYIVRGGDIDVLEGEAPAGRTVVVEFPDRTTALQVVPERGLRQSPSAPAGGIRRTHVRR